MRAGLSDLYLAAIFTPHKLGLAALVGLIAAGLALQALIFQSTVPPAGLILAIGSAVAAAALTTRRRWAPAVGAV